MAKFIFIYHGGTKPKNPEHQNEVMAKWSTWFERMGDAVIDGGAPVGQSNTVSAKGVENNGGPNPISGYTFVEAADIGAATALANGSPQLETGGTIEVAEVMEMPG